VAIIFPSDRVVMMFPSDRGVTMMASASAAEQPAHHGPWRGRDGAHHSSQNVRLRGAGSDRKACPNTRATSKTPTHIRLPGARPASTNAGDRSEVPQCALR